MATWDHMRRVAAAHKNDPPLCEHCGERPSECLGAYEGDEDPSFACGVCCAHGCEDGHCEQIVKET